MSCLLLQGKKENKEEKTPEIERVEEESGKFKKLREIQRAFLAGAFSEIT